MARLHLTDDKPSIEGILAGRWNGHYVVLRPSIYETAERSHSLTGHVEVPAANVVFVQVLN